MTAEIQYWDYRASELQQKEAAGKTNSKLNSKLASRRADDLTARMQARLAEIEKGAPDFSDASGCDWRSADYPQRGCCGF